MIRPRALDLRLKRRISQGCIFLEVLLQQSLSNWWLLKLFYLLSMRIKLPHRVTSLTVWRGDIGYTPRGGGRQEVTEFAACYNSLYNNLGY